MQEEWIIDGYNVIHHLKSKRRPSDIPTLCSRLADHAAFQKISVMLVLDGNGPSQDLEPLRSACFQALYSGKVSADTFIERYVCENRGRSQMVVITQDRAISNIASGAGARVRKPDELLEALDRTSREKADVLFKERVQGHGFNRPFEKKL